MSQTAAASAGREGPIHGHDEPRAQAGFLSLTLGCIGVVYGDIGTSPLYALREAVVAAVGSEHAPTREASHWR